MNAFEECQDKYAELAVKVGVNIQPSQTLLIFADVDSAAFTRKVVTHAYKAGARHVYVDWSDHDVTLTKYLLAPDEAFAEFPSWKAQQYTQLAHEGCALLAIRSPYPDMLTGVDPNRIATSRKVAAEATKEFTDYQMQRKMRWSVVAIPTESWAEKVFPNVDVSVAIEKLWNMIFKIIRVDQPDPVTAWKNHLDNLKAKRAFLDAKNYKRLHYRSPGTDLSIELPENHTWFGGYSPNADGIASVANIPTEEVFTLPKRDGVNGTVRATMPLSYSGTIIEGLSLTFENGRIVEFRAQKGHETLEKLINTDEGSHYLGEVALVPVDSPISDSRLIFQETLYDENASCHLAIGQAYPCFKDSANMSQADYEARGSNASLVHVDFMIGSSELDIDGETQDGQIEPIFRRGRWA